MEGFILTVPSKNQHRRSLQKKKTHEWRNLFVKLDDISARLIAFPDRSQFQVCWSVSLVGADISTPVPGEPSNGIDVDDTPYCFYVRETSAVKDCTHYFSAADDSAKKKWVKALTQVARDGPRAPHFTVSHAENEFEFHARVVKFRPHVDGTHAEYMITCSCQVFSKKVARRLIKDWSFWRRFSEFDQLHEALKQSMGPQLEGIELVKHKRDAFRGVLGQAFDHNFLEERRVLLDSFVTNVCKIRTAVDFFKHHSDPHLKTFFQFDDNCQDVDQSPRKGNGIRNKSRNTSGPVPASSPLTDSNVDTNPSHPCISTASDAASEGGRSRSKGSRGTRRNEVDERRTSTSSQASTSSRTSTSSHASTSSRSSGPHAFSYKEDGSSHHHRRHHHKKHGDADEDEPLSSTKKDRLKSGLAQGN